MAKALSWAETLRILGYCPTGNNPATVKKYVKLWGIDTEHFDPTARACRLRVGPERIDGLHSSRSSSRALGTAALC